MAIVSSSSTASKAVPSSGAWSNRSKKVIRVWSSNSSGEHSGYISGWATLPSRLIQYVPPSETNVSTSFTAPSTLRNSTLDFGAYATGQYELHQAPNLQWLRIQKASTLMFNATLKTLVHDLDETLQSLTATGPNISTAMLSRLTGLTYLVWSNAKTASVVSVEHMPSLSIVSFGGSTTITELVFGSKSYGGLGALNVGVYATDCPLLTTIDIGSVTIQSGGTFAVGVHYSELYTTDSLYDTINGLTIVALGPLEYAIFDVFHLYDAGNPGQLADGIEHTASEVLALAASKGITIQTN